MNEVQKIINIGKYQARYAFETIVENKTIFSRDNRFTSITFENIGDTPAFINGLIPCNNNGVVREFVELPNTTIHTDFTITFDQNNMGTDPKILVVKTYYTKTIGE